jgi:hypothetical protein
MPVMQTSGGLASPKSSTAANIAATFPLVLRVRTTPSERGMKEME